MVPLHRVPIWHPMTRVPCGTTEGVVYGTTIWHRIWCHVAPFILTVTEKPAVKSAEIAKSDKCLSKDSDLKCASHLELRKFQLREVIRIRRTNCLKEKHALVDISVSLR